MKASYDDILALGAALGKQPQWFDLEGTPRYCEPEPHHCSNIYASKFAVVRIACQACGEEFLVEAYSTRLRDFEREQGGHGEFPEHFHYGDPPSHEVQYPHHEQPTRCAGETMNSVGMRVERLWVREHMDWQERDASSFNVKPDWYDEWESGEDSYMISPEDEAELAQLFEGEEDPSHQVSSRQLLDEAEDAAAAQDSGEHG